MGYKAPLDDIAFVLFDVLGGEAVPDRDLALSVLAAKAEFCERVIAPLAEVADRVGCRLEGGAVRTPPGFAAAFRAYREAGWTAACAPEAYGGQGLPRVLGVGLDEMEVGANLAFTAYPGLTRGVVETLHAHADAETKALFLPPLIAGRWTGTMCLTEPQCGSDLGLIRTRARPLPNGRFALEGGKIYITSGDHDLAENIVHLVLARLEGAPPGVRGISLFLAPKRKAWPGPGMGAPNGVTCIGVEDKMGMHGSATCALAFEGAEAQLIGEPHKGLAAMFTMMNSARLNVGLQGYAVADAAFQMALDHARNRLQGRSPLAPPDPSRPADPIILHPDVRRMLLTMRATIEGGRLLAHWVGAQLDRLDADPSPELAALVGLMTPVLKADLTDQGLAMTSLAIQVHGGSGYVRGTGVERLMRDARILPIYEGTNGIQAADLVGRKLGADGGRGLTALLAWVDARIADGRGTAALAAEADRLAAARDTLLRTTRRLLAMPAGEQMAAAADYLRLTALVAQGGAWLWAGAAAGQIAAADPDRSAFAAAKLRTARFFFAAILPEVATREAAIQQAPAILADARDV